MVGCRGLLLLPSSAIVPQALQPQDCPAAPSIDSIEAGSTTQIPRWRIEGVGNNEYYNDLHNGFWRDYVSWRPGCNP
ncbi:hypothetical protein BJ166DRAFT_4447 [Pestalotiopsis sp. NC0098]|nr:hypothetical protein BJ166DRAFT_4447 [Pestalotiopsis sp. NC0098]